MMKAIIVEDEEDSRLVLDNIIRKFCDNVEVVGLAVSVKDAVKLINEHHPDLVFLDIELPDENGFKLFEYFTNPSFEVIFTTAYSQYALNALKMSAIDYLLKPIDLDELREAVKMVSEKRALKMNKEKLEVLKGNLNNLFQKLALPTPTGYIFASIKDITYCESSSNYTMFYFSNKEKTLVSKTLKVFEEILQEFNFVRVNRGQLVNLNYVKEYGRFKNSTLTMEDGTVVKLSASRRDEFLNKIKNFFID